MYKFFKTASSLDELIDFRFIIKYSNAKANHLNFSLTGLFSNADIELAQSGFCAFIEIIKEIIILPTQLLYATPAM